jgi:hypothetical protein
LTDELPALVDEEVIVRPEAPAQMRDSFVLNPRLSVCALSGFR